MPDPFKVVLTDDAKKDIRRHRDVAPAIVRHLEALAARPDAGDPLVGDLAGSRSLKFSNSER